MSDPPPCTLQMPYTGECDPLCDSSPVMRRICALRLLHDLALFLDRGRVDEIFRIAENDSRAADGFAQRLAFGHHSVQHLPLV